MAFTGQQEDALKRVKEWFEDESSPQVFKLFGYAGTGKTTLAKFFAENVKGWTQYSAFTGKACQVLRNKGCHNAATLHSLIYKAKQMPDGNVKFVRNVFDSPLMFAKLIVTDEVSMVGNELAEDLLAFGKKVLVLGDPAQLPPVKSSEGYFMKDPDIVLTEVHRQAADNPIIALSMHLRAQKPLRKFFGKNTDRDHLRLVDGVTVTEALAMDQIICGKNKTRDIRNRRFRDLKGFEGIFPNVGEKLICLKNNSSEGLFNGQMWELTNLEEKPGFRDEESGKELPEHLYFYGKSLDDEGIMQTRVLKELFTGGFDTIHWSIKKFFDEFDFGYCVTCHKSQGSQWNNILLYDESYVFRDDKFRWLYTAVTRAAEKLTIIEDR